MANYTLDPEDKKVVQADLMSWMEIQDRRKELSGENKSIIENTARILNTKTTMVSKLFKVLRKRMEEGDDELAELSVLVDEIG